MEFHLLPVHRGNPPIPIPKTPYVASERYDGGPWLSYPSRKGMLRDILKDGAFDALEYTRAERVNPTLLHKYESFFQTWLYFGLIGEFTGVNGTDVCVEGNPSESINHLYRMILVEDGKFVKLDKECLDEFLALSREKMPKDLDARKAHYNHLALCLSYAFSCTMHTPREFNHAVRCSIAALGELFMTTLNTALEMVGLPVFGRDWTPGFLNDEDRKSMIAHGWCPSDISRAEEKYLHIETLFIARMLDKTLPPRDHSRCMPSICNLYQIHHNNYKPQHQTEGCKCTQLVVQEENLTAPLFKEGRFPLILLKGNTENLTYEIVESGRAPYIAISHVWADGLGNPLANSLQKCKLQHLRSLVDAINEQDPEQIPPKQEGSLIWLDTLLSPARDGIGKQAAIEKIRLVYQQAKHVLVLDAGLMAYPARPQDAPEMLVRIFTSSWMRRLWTLQEGALAKSLYFQFSDEARSLNELALSVFQMKGNMSYRAVTRDVYLEMMGLIGFFNPSIETPGGMLSLLDRALQFRSVSVPSDEPLCIGTLLSLDLKAILQAPKTLEARMQKVWELVAIKNGGIPSQVLFLEGERLAAKGWRWAPRGLLCATSCDGTFTLSTRITRWAESQLGQPTPRGLKVKYPGYRIMIRRDYRDSKPPNPWPGMPRIPENWLQFQDPDTGKLYRITEKKHAALTKTWVTDTERRQHGELGLFPLADLAQTGKSIIVVRPSSEVREAVFAEIESDSVVGLEKSDGSIAVKTKYHILIHELREESYIYEVVGRLALQLRAHEMTDKYLSLYQSLSAGMNISSEYEKKLREGNEEFKTLFEALRDQMKTISEETIKADERFRNTVKNTWGDAFLEDLGFNSGFLQS
jgi:hypothetical protein